MPTSLLLPTLVDERPGVAGDLAQSAAATPGRHPAARCPTARQRGQVDRLVLRASTQVSLEPPPWLELTTSVALGQGDPGQPAGQQPHVVAVVDRERAQVDVPRRDALADQRRRGRQRDRALGDPAARVGAHGPVEREQLLLLGERPDDDALAAGAVDRLEHQLVQVGQHALQASPGRRADASPHWTRIGSSPR